MVQDSCLKMFVKPVILWGFLSLRNLSNILLDHSISNAVVGFQILDENKQLKIK